MGWNSEQKETIQIHFGIIFIYECDATAWTLLTSFCASYCHFDKLRQYFIPLKSVQFFCDPLLNILYWELFYWGALEHLWLTQIFVFVYILSWQLAKFFETIVEDMRVAYTTGINGKEKKTFYFDFILHKIRHTKFVTVIDLDFAGRPLFNATHTKFVMCP